MVHLCPENVFSLRKIAIALLFALALFGTVQAEKIEIYDNFESYQVSTYPSPTWENLFSGKTAYVSDYWSWNGQKESKSFKLEGYPSWARIDYIPIPQMPDKISYEVVVYPTSTDGGRRADVGFVEGFGNYGPMFNYISFRGDGNIYWVGSESVKIGTWELGKAYRVRAEIDFISQTADIYLEDGVFKLVAKDVPALPKEFNHQRWGHVKLSKFGLGTGNFQDSGTNVVYFDDIKLETFKRIWPVDAPTTTCYTSGGNALPSTGENSADWFNYGSCGNWKVFDVTPGKELKFALRGDQCPSCPGCVLGNIDFDIYEFVNGQWVLKDSVDGPNGYCGFYDYFYYYTPQSDRIKVVARGGFYIELYQEFGSGYSSHDFKVTISNPNNNKLNDFQVRVDLSSFTDYVGNYQVLNSDGNALNFCFEQSNEECNQTPTSVLWVKVPNIPALGSTTIHIKKSQSNKASNGGEVFDFYDDFSQNLDPNVWWTLGNVSVSSSELRLSGAWVITQNETMNSNQILEARIKPGMNIEDRDISLIFFCQEHKGHPKGYNAGFNLHFNSLGNNVIQIGKWYPWQTLATKSFVIDTNRYYKLSAHKTSNVVNLHVDNESLSVTDSTYVKGYFGILSANYQNAVTHVDWIRLRKNANVNLEIYSNIDQSKPPTADFAYYPSNPIVSEIITFNASSSYDPDGYIVIYEWNFGDGNVETTTSPTIQHTYSSPGTYTVTLTVTDNDGLTASTSKQITVQNITPGTEVTRSLPLWVEPGSTFPVNITSTASTLGMQIIENIPSGFTFLNYTYSGADSVNFQQSGNTLTFTVTDLGFDGFTITYTLQAPTTEGTYTFSGTYQAMGGNVYTIGGDTTLTVSAGETIPDGVDDSLEQIVSKYYSDFDWTSDTPTQDDVLQAVINAVSQYFSTNDPAEQQEILGDVIQLVGLYFQL